MLCWLVASCHTSLSAFVDHVIHAADLSRMTTSLQHSFTNVKVELRLNATDDGRYLLVVYTLHACTCLANQREINELI